jgi:serine-protein kinase ATM
VHPIDILNLLRTCLGLPTLSLSWSSNSPRGIIGQSWLQHLDREEILRYLLLLDDFSTKTFRCPKCSISSLLHRTEHLSDSSAYGHATRRLILELFLPRFELLVQDWGSRNTEESVQVSTDTMRCTVSACIFGCLLLSLTQDPRLVNLLKQLERAVEGLATFALAQLREEEQTRTLLESTLQALQPYLPTSNPLELTHLYRSNPYLLQLFNLVSDQLHLQSQPFNKTPAAEVHDAMELDDIFDTQQSRSKVGGMKCVSARRDVAIASSPMAFYQATLTRLILISTAAKSANSLSTIPSEFINYLVELPDPEILSCRQPLQTILRSDLLLDPADALRLVQRIGKLLASAEYVSCEVALGLCLDILTCEAPLWCSSGEIERELKESATQLYEWLIDTVFPKRRPSLNVQIGLADLLCELMRVQPEFKDRKPLPSVRSCLFDVFQKGPICVKFHISGQLPNLFNLFILKRHNEILVDVIESLPSDPDWAEGIAFRLHVLAGLASRWPTLIRLCTYYILEVPGKLPKSMNHATRCLTKVSKSLGLKDPRDLFKLFASQLLYTWLITESLGNIPYGIFGYSTLRDLVEDAKEEIASLMIMRNQDNAVADLALLLEITVEQLLQQCFTKVIAYSVAHDICVPHAEMGKKYVTGEARIRKWLGRDVFYNLVNVHFPDIIALFFNLIEQEECIVEKSFTKDPKLLYAAEAMNDIKDINFSDVVLPPSQQPAFKAKYLTSQIEHICGRTEYDIANLYTPPMVTFIARRVLNSIHPALGSLHTCSVLRKLRVLIALSGRTALEGYPLEMLVHSIRPFITDAECADDSIGMIQYLLAKGSTYLAKSPSFVAGISLSILASLRAFLESSPSSTTQQSQYQSTLTKAQAFHSWLGSFLVSYDTSSLNKASETAFRAIVQSAHDFRSEGNGEIGTAESSLLIELLEDELSGRQLLNKPSQDLAFALLYANFKQPHSFRNDIFGTDEKAVMFAVTLWNLCKNGPVGGSLLIWVGKVLGRAFAATGHIHQLLLQESGVRRILEITSGTFSNEISKSCLLRLLQTLTQGDDRQTAGLAEAVLRVIITGPDRPPDESEAIVYDRSLSKHLYQASFWAPFYVPPSDLSVFRTEAPNDPYCASAILELHWSRSLAISLVQSVPSEALLYALQRLLGDAERFADEAFPFIIHLVLLLQFDGQPVARKQLSEALRTWFDNEDPSVIPHLKLLINSLLYLRTQALPRESSSADRINWLDVDYAQAARAAVRCRMFKTALLFSEISVSENTRASRRSSSTKLVEPNNLLLSIFENIDDPDVFYGLQQNSSLCSILARLEYEKDGLKSLAFRGAQYDSHLRRQDKSSISDAQSLVSALGMLNLDGLSYSLQSQQGISLDPISLENMFQTARKLEQWDLPVPSASNNEAVTIYKTFQSINTAEDRPFIIEAIHEGLQTIMLGILRESADTSIIHTSLQSLAVLTEMDEVLSASNSEEFKQMLGRFHSRSNWMKTGK